MKFFSDNTWNYVLNKYIRGTKTNLKGNDDNIRKFNMLRSRIGWAFKRQVKFKWRQERFRALVMYRIA